MASKGLIGAGVEIGEDMQKFRNPFMNPMFIFRQLVTNHRIARSMSSSKRSVPEYFYLWEHLHPSLKEPSSYLEQSSVKFIMAVKGALVNYGRATLDHDYSLRSMADMAMHIYAMNSVLARTSRSYSIGIKNSQHELNMAQLQARDSRLVVNECYNRIFGETNGMGLEEIRKSVAEEVFRAKEHAATHSMSRNY